MPKLGVNGENNAIRLRTVTSGPTEGYDSTSGTGYSGHAILYVRDGRAYIKDNNGVERVASLASSGLASARPATPTGVGDFYFATDTGVLSVAATAGNTWDTFDLSNIGGGGSTIPSGGTLEVPANPTEVGQIFFDNETGDLYLANGSGDGWLGPYNLPSIGTGGGGVTVGVKLVFNGTDIEVTDTQDYYFESDWDTEPWDTSGMYDAGTATLAIVEDGLYDIMGWVDVYLGSAALSHGRIVARVDCPVDELGNTGVLTEATLMIPAGTPTTFLYRLFFHARANLAALEEPELHIVNEVGDSISIFIDKAEMSIVKLGDQLATP